MSLQNAAIILGAGASKGAKVPGERTPPLDAEFLNVAARHFGTKRNRKGNNKSVAAWKSFKSSLSKAKLDFNEVRHWRLEQLSTFLEAKSNLNGAQLGPGRPRDFSQALEALKTVVCHVLNIEGGANACELHQLLFRHSNPKAVVSFNYDLIADQSLASLGKLNWTCLEYCGDKRIDVEGKRKPLDIQKLKISDRVPLIKLHGSMHYCEMSGGDEFLLSGVSLPNNIGDSFQFLNVPKHPFIIPPVAAKIGIRQRALKLRWSKALHYLDEAPLWIIWGYSFPTTDTISQVLFRTALTNNRKPKPVIVVNPDHSVVNRVREVCRKVRIEYYPSIERLLYEHQMLIAKE